MPALLSTKLKNQLLALRPNLTVQLKNVNVNGVKMGCTGFITDPDTERIVYVCTDNNHNPQATNVYYRVARSTKDYTGGRNQFAHHDDLAQSVVSLLESSQFDRELSLAR